MLNTNRIDWSVIILLILLKALSVSAVHSNGTCCLSSILISSVTWLKSGCHAPICCAAPRNDLISVTLFGVLNAFSASIFAGSGRDYVSSKWYSLPTLHFPNTQCDIAQITSLENLLKVFCQMLNISLLDQNIIYFLDGRCPSQGSVCGPAGQSPVAKIM